MRQIPIKTAGKLVRDEFCKCGACYEHSDRQVRQSGPIVLRHDPSPPAPERHSCMLGAQPPLLDAKTPPASPNAPATIGLKQRPVDVIRSRRSRLPTPRSIALLKTA